MSPFRPPPGRSAEAAQAVAPDVVASDAPERPITVDQTNVSVVVGEAVVVKWLLPPVPHPSPTVTLLQHLAAAGFTEMPAFHGQIVEQVDGEQKVTAMVSAFVPDALDGWDWYVDDLTASLDAGDLSGPIGSATAIGALAGRLHASLATPTSFVPEPSGLGDATDERIRGLALLEEALDCTLGEERKRLAARADRIRSAIDELTAVGTVPIQHVHGDLHVGQLLRSPRVLVVNDFDGNPIVLAAERHRMRSAMVDLASLMQSVDHVGRIVAKRRPDDAEAIDAFIAAALPALQASYREVRPAADGDEELLLALRAIQELHEYVYAARELPRWLYVPDAAMRAMFP